MEDEELFPHLTIERPIMPTIETLKDWINAMHNGNPRGKIDLKSAFNLVKIFNDDKFNAVIFDNAGGMMFAIWEFNTPEEVDGFMAIDTFGIDLIFGHVKDGVQTLCEYQKQYPNWNIKPISK